MRLKSGAFSRCRPRFVTLIVLCIVAAPIVVANLSRDERPEQEWTPNPLYGWPLIWYWCDFKPSSTLPGGGGVRWNGPRLAGNLVLWSAMLAVLAAACEWLRRRSFPRLSFRPRLVTLIVLVLVAAPIVLSNLSGHDARLSWPKPTYGWPLIWRWRDQQSWYGVTVLDWNFSAARLTGNLAIWLVMLGAAGVPCEWLLRRYQPRLRWSLRMMLAAVALLAVLCAWCAALRERANLQDPIISTYGERGIGNKGVYLYLERWGPEWLDLVGADRFRRRVVGAGLNHYYDGDRVEFLKRLGQLPSLRYLNLSVTKMTPSMAAALADIRKLQTLRIASASDDGVISQEYLAAVSELVRLEELHLGGTTVSGSLAYLAGLTNLKSLSLQVDWYDEESLLATLPALPRLEAIDLRGLWGREMVGDQDLRRLAVLPRLKSLNLSDVNVTDAGMAELASPKFLEELAIGGDMATEELLQSLCALQHLKKLHIQRYEAVTEALLLVLPTFNERGANQNGELLSALERLKELRFARFGSYDQSDRMTTLMLDHGDAIFALESEVKGLQQAMDALRQSNPGLVIDSDPKWFDPNRGKKRQESPWEP